MSLRVMKRQVFDRFLQHDSSTTRAFGGLGLGLAICKQLVELHGGSIRAASQGEGMGATFFVQRPLSIVQLDDQSAPRIHSTAEVQPGETLGLPRLEGVQVFAVDDEPDARALLRTVLEDQGAMVTRFGSAPALVALKTRKPTMLICDIGLPKMDGYQLIRTLRAQESRGERIPAHRGLFQIGREAWPRHLRALLCLSQTQLPCASEDWAHVAVLAISPATRYKRSTCNRGGRFSVGLGIRIPGA